jgi:betaine lipid synthase
MELKLAAIKSLDYDDFFALFGRGQHPNFRGLLDSKIAPHLSSSAYQFWRIKDGSFSSSFYLHGYSGWALRLASFIFRLAGVSKDIIALCNSDTLQQQEKIWKEKLRPVILNPVVVALLKNPVFCWNALGVPINQRNMILNEGVPTLIRLIMGYQKCSMQVESTSSSVIRWTRLPPPTYSRLEIISISWCVLFLLGLS